MKAVLFWSFKTQDVKKPLSAHPTTTSLSRLRTYLLKRETVPSQADHVLNAKHCSPSQGPRGHETPSHPKQCTLFTLASPYLKTQDSLLPRTALSEYLSCPVDDSLPIIPFTRVQVSLVSNISQAKTQRTGEKHNPLDGGPSQARLSVLQIASSPHRATRKHSKVLMLNSSRGAHDLEKQSCKWEAKSWTKNYPWDRP